jgi:hypothetical protein
MGEFVALELAVVDLIEARALDPADCPMPEPPHPFVTPGRLFPKASNDREYQAHSPDDVADPARKLIRHPEVLCLNKTRHVGGSREVSSAIK